MFTDAEVADGYMAGGGFHGYDEIGRAVGHEDAATVAVSLFQVVLTYVDDSCWVQEQLGVPLYGREVGGGEQGDRF